MSAGDIQPYASSGHASTDSALRYYVKAGSKGADGTVSRIKAGEPVTKAVGATGVLAAVTNTPTTILKIVGVAAETSTETASVDGSVAVIPAMPGQFWLLAADTAATWDTQAEYNALCGSRVLMKNTSGVYTMLASDAGANGCIVEYIDVLKYPGVVCFSWSPQVNYGFSTAP